MVGDQLLSAYDRKGRRHAFQAFMHVVLSVGHSEYRRSKISWGGKFVNLPSSWIFEFNFSLRSCIIRDAPTLSPFLQACPNFFEQPTPFPHIPFVYCAFTTHFNSLHVNFCRMIIFSVWNFHHRLHYTCDFFLPLLTTANRGKRMTPCYLIHVFFWYREDEWPSQEGSASPVLPLLPIGSYFLEAPRVYWSGSIYNK